MSSFDARAQEWDKNQRRRQTAQKVASAIKECLPGGYYDILDFGCGTGLVSFELVDLAKSITGLDTSAKMVEEFNKKSDDPHIRAYQTRLEDLPGSFDLIVSSMTFHHIEDIDTLIHNLAKKLRPEGFVCVADLVSEDGSFHSDNQGVHHFGFDPRRLAKTFERHGFVKRCSKIVHTIQKHRAFDIFLLCFQKSP